MDRMFCSRVVQEIVANNLCFKFHQVYLVIIPYLTSYMIVIDHR